MRHVGGVAGSFSADGKMLNSGIFADSLKFYQTAPANFYAKFLHDHSLLRKSYAFPYDDAGEQAPFVGHDGPVYMLVAIGY